MYLQLIQIPVLLLFPHSWFHQPRNMFLFHLTYVNAKHIFYTIRKITAKFGSLVNAVASTTDRAVAACS